MNRIFIFLVFILLTTAKNAEQLPIEAFGKLPEASQVKLSPDGNKIAFLRVIKGDIYIGVTDLEAGKTKYIVKSDNEIFKIGWFRWANNKMILISADFPVIDKSLKYSEARLLKINADGSNKAETVIKVRSIENIPQFQNNIIDMLPDEPNHILMALDLKINNRPDVYKIDLTKNNSRQLIYKSRGYIHDWMVDQQHRVRLGFGRNETKIFYRLLDVKTNKWRNVWEYELFDAPDITPLGFGLDPNYLYIRALNNERYAIFKVDVSKDELPRELVYADEEYDIEGSLIYSNKTRDVIGVYHGEADNAKVFFESSYAMFQEALNKAIPDSYNNISSMSVDERKYILFSSSPDRPGAYYLGNRDTKDLSFILEQYPLLFQKKLSGKSKITYKARDGLDIEGYVTLPHIKESNNAAIIIPHGGPMARDYGGFDWFAEFFASRGYTVLQPNFRGSSGYGFQFEMASIQNWGGAMQDDLADGAHWLLENYKIDKQRVCIVGASYGGYAALMAAVKQQDTFKCAASFAGVFDLEYILKDARMFTNKDVVIKQFGRDTNRLENNSPVNHAKAINIPVLLIHGNKDRVVDIKHSKKMFSELEGYAKSVEFIELENGNHHLEIEKNRLRTLEAIDDFLSKNILH